MIIGILSDTHDRIEPAMAGMHALQTGGAEYFIHCGDVGSPRIIDLFIGLRAALVWGNNDWDRNALTRYAEMLGVRVFQTDGQLELDGKHFAVTHGDNLHIVHQYIEQQQVDYLLLGHSHVKTDTRSGRIRVINPGALHRASVKTVALLNTATDELRFLAI